MLSDIEIAQQAKLAPITQIAESVNLTDDDIELFGKYKAKISFAKLKELQTSVENPQNRGKLILVTAITPTPAGEGKSTVSIGLGDALKKIGKKTVIALREPSLGPCFGIKGGAAGGGYSQIVPMEEINLHFTGDIHAISAANNLISSIIDNHIHQGNKLHIDPRTISWKRCVDLNDRVLRKIVIGLGGATEGVTREDSFSISVASEIMAIVCLSRTITELKARLNSIVVAQTYSIHNALTGIMERKFIKLSDLGIAGAVAALLKDAIRPNLVQTLEQTPVFVHGGPFANIAHGCNSLNATLSALALGDYVVTEAGFAADLGAEKFMDIKCRIGGLKPNAVVIVATIRALKMHGGVLKADLQSPNVSAVEKGFENLKVHIENMKKFGMNPVVALNHFVTDTKEEINALQKLTAKLGVKAILTEGWGKGGEGATELAQEVVKICDEKNNFTQLYELELPLIEKIRVLAKEIYRAKDIDISPLALKKLKLFTDSGYGTLPVCVAKTQNSISHDKTKVGAPCDYIFPVRDVQLYSGAGFVAIFAGDIMTMPGLPKVPAALNIDIDDNGKISGLF